MTDEELERLAALIAAEVDRLRGGSPGASPSGHDPWLPVPVRPEPPARSADPPPWSGAGQRLGDVAPIRAPEPSSHRADFAESAAVVRAAAAGQAVARAPTAGRTNRAGGGPPRRSTRGPMEVPVGVSNHHVHLSTADATTLFGSPDLASHRPLTQPGQFAAVQRVTVVGPRGRIEGIRAVGPARGETQLELSLGDAAVLGVTPVIANSGRLGNSAGGVTLEGPGGHVALQRGVIVPARHLHLAPADGQRWRLRDGDQVTLRCGEGARAATWHGVLVRCGPTHATELHLDVDEARAAGVVSGAIARIVGHTPAAGRPRTLVTERDVLALATRGERIPDGALLTPSARDRARALGLDPG